MTDPKIRKVEKVTLSSVKNKNEKVMVRSTFARAFQVCGEKFSTKSAKLSGILQINRLFGTTWFIYRAEFWKYILMDGELGGETYIDVLLVSSALSPPNFTLIGNDDFLSNLVWIIPMTMETRFFTKVIFPNYSKRKRLKIRSYRRYGEHGKINGFLGLFVHDAVRGGTCAFT